MTMEFVPGNSTTTALADGTTFTGDWVNGQGFTSVMVVVATDQTGNFYVDFSEDKTNVDSTLTYKYTAGTVEPPHRLKVTRRWFRVRMTNNSGSAQTYLRLSTFLDKDSGILSSPLNSLIHSDADAIMVRSRDTEFDVASGRMQGVSIVNKFGRNPSVSTADVPEDIWNGGGVYTGFPTGSAELVTVVSSSVNDTANGSGARTVKLYGLDADGYDQEETVTLNGQTPVDSVNTWKRVFRCRVLTSGSSNQAFNAGTITVAHKVTTSNVFSVMPIGTNQTALGLYTIPKDKTGYLRKMTVKADRSNAVTVNGAIWVRDNGASPRLIRPFVITNAIDYDDVIYGGIVMPELTDFAIRITACTANNVAIIANFDLLLVDN